MGECSPYESMNSNNKSNTNISQDLICLRDLINVTWLNK